MLESFRILERLDISTTSVIRAVQDVRQRVETSASPKSEALRIISEITGETIDVESNIDALHIAQSVVENAILQKETFVPEKALELAHKRVEQYRNNPALQYIYVAENQLQQNETQEIAGVSVVINENGKIKKGGKALIAKQLFKELVVDKKMSKKDFIEQLMQQCKMSRAGATTYEHNVRKEYEKETGVQLFHEKSARGRKKKVVDLQP